MYSFFAMIKRIGRKALIQPPLPFNAHENFKKINIQVLLFPHLIGVKSCLNVCIFLRLG